MFVCGVGRKGTFSGEVGRGGGDRLVVMADFCGMILIIKWATEKLLSLFLLTVLLTFMLRASDADDGVRAGSKDCGSL